jgi:hypothetical protein
MGPGRNINDLDAHRRKVMAKLKTSNGKIKQAVKKALREVFMEDREFLREVLLEAIEDIALGELIMEARKMKKYVPRSTVMKILKGQK